jgi:hypothetical protein
MMRALIAALVLASAHAAMAQQPAPAPEFPARFTGYSRAALESIADSARVVTLPVEPLTAKAAEGVLKGADDERIVRAVRSLLHELMDARVALSRDTSTAVLTAAASALHAGASRASLRNLAAASAGAPSGDLAAALVTLADLAAARAPVDDTERAIVELLKRRAPAAELSAFRQSVRQDILAGADPRAALSARAQATLGSLRPTP